VILPKYLAVGRARHADADRQARAVARQADHPDVMAEILPPNSRRYRIAGQRQHLLLENRGSASTAWPSGDPPAAPRREPADPASACRARPTARLLGKITADGVFLEELESNPARFLPEIDEKTLGGEVVPIDLKRPMSEIRQTLSRHPIKTRLSLTGTLIVARDIAHAKLQERLDRGESLPQYVKDHPIYYAGPAKTARGLRLGLVRADDGGTHGLVCRPLHGGRRQLRDPWPKQSRRRGARGLPEAWRLLPRVDRRPAARLAQDCIKKVELLEYPELGMEAIWRIEVVDFPPLSSSTTRATISSPALS